jgi:3-hydroxybutyrate dehydrogenase
MTLPSSDPGSAPLSGRTALVTGAGSGIGRAIACRFAADGAEVIAVDRDSASLDRLAAEIGAKPLVLELSDIDSLPAAIESVAGGIDILVNNAGIQHVERLESFPIETFEKILRIMLTAPFVLTRAVLPGMYERGFGRIIHLSSAHGRRASPFKVAYVSAKHGLEGLSKVIALEGAEHGVTSNCVNPGYVRTPLVEAQIADQAVAHGLSESEVLSKVILASSPVKRLIEPEEVASAAAYLCAPGSASITGSNLVLDGGWGAR